jgi:hypothetical protein
VGVGIIERGRLGRTKRDGSRGQWHLGDGQLGSSTTAGGAAVQREDGGNHLA